MQLRASGSWSLPLSTPSSTLRPLNGRPPPGGDDGPHKELQNWSSLIGIVTAIVGNILIALALNVQRYAHIRIHRRRAQARDRAKQALKNAAKRRRNRAGAGYGTTDSTANGDDGVGGGVVCSPLNGSRSGEGAGYEAEAEDEYDDVPDARESDPLAQSFQSTDSRSSDDGEQPRVASTYLKDPYWWLGQVLITVGEMGNFLAYGFAPASIVSPLGVVALISNCVIAPILFKEVFRQRDFWGVVIAIAGVVTVVSSANQKETKLAPHDVWDAITTMAFEIYLGVTCALIMVLMWASPRYGSRTILVDLGLVGLFGGYTALATKGVSSMLSSTLLGAFTTPVTYALVLVLLSTAVMQVRYLNKALQRFESTQVIPIQFVLFTLSVIIGSAVLYRDFEETTAEQAVKFVGGCLLTFFGVFLITSGRSRINDDEGDILSDADGVEETIGLAEQDTTTTPRTPQRPSRRASGSTGSRRPAGRLFSEILSRPLRSLVDGRITGWRTKQKGSSGDRQQEGPVPSSAEALWHNAEHAQGPEHPGAGSRAISSDAVLEVSWHASDAASPRAPRTPRYVRPTDAHSSTTRRTASLSRHSHPSILDGPFISPSPFSSTVSAVVADKILQHVDGSILRRNSAGAAVVVVAAAARSRRLSVRSGLFGAREDEDERQRQRQQQVVGAALPSSGNDETIDDGRNGHQGPLSGPRSRARTLSNTIGEFLGLRRNPKEAVLDGEEDDLLTQDAARWVEDTNDTSPALA
ncbi:hypothetical protein VTK73DRAFT_1325 [Phialemonium thermophilum]|uniref:Uncharacterized protein n=1 Tax=Phialemonium thermophilum TaxID=223376 RepID=A0ABR3XAS9_9PEZI